MKPNEPALRVPVIGRRSIRLGFTLIKLLVVLAVVAVLVPLLLPAT